MIQARSIRKLKYEVFEAYSKGEEIQCRCCGEKYLEFLCLDHIFGSGYREALRGKDLYRKLKKDGWPRQDEFQLLCFSCNACKANHANVCVCPYKKKRKKK